MSSSKIAMVDETMPDGAWKFDGGVAEVFDDMLARSIPQYGVMRAAVTDFAVQHLPSRGTLVDLGCSRGAALARVAEERPNARYIGVEISDPMIAAAKEAVPFADIRKMDLRKAYPAETADVTLSVLTLQFTPIEYRQRLLARIRNHSKVFIMVEKVLGATAQINDNMVEHYYGLKGKNGYSPEAIERKRLSLEGVLVPMTAKWNEDLLHMAGFTQVDCFWRWMNFAGWIAFA